jgi:hypothetical protein
VCSVGSVPSRVDPMRLMYSIRHGAVLACRTSVVLTAGIVHVNGCVAACVLKYRALRPVELRDALLGPVSCRLPALADGVRALLVGRVNRYAMAHRTSSCGWRIRLVRSMAPHC